MIVVTMSELKQNPAQKWSFPHSGKCQDDFCIYSLFISHNAIMHAWHTMRSNYVASGMCWLVEIVKLRSDSICPNHIDFMQSLFHFSLILTVPKNFNSILLAHISILSAISERRCPQCNIERWLHRVRSLLN